jgi:hypothetical protein
VKAACVVNTRVPCPVTLSMSVDMSPPLGSCTDRRERRHICELVQRVPLHPGPSRAQRQSKRLQESEGAEAATAEVRQQVVDAI